MRWYHIVIFILLVVIGVLAWAALKNPPTPPLTQTPHPATTTPSVPTSTQTPAAPLSSRVTISSPMQNETVTVPFTVTGQAPGPWYFEATFPVQVRDSDDNVIAHGHANAQGDWMTDKQVAFTATINLDTPYSGAATLILLKDNPSGLPENDDSVTIPIVIK